MQISSRFTMAIHMFACMDVFHDQKVTSELMASSIGTNPVIIRKLLQQLKKARLVKVEQGVRGVRPARDLKDISFLDLYRAVECTPQEELFHFHENPNPLCPVGSHVHAVLDGRLEHIQSVMEQEMAKISLASVMADFHKITDEETHVSLDRG